MLAACLLKTVLKLPKRCSTSHIVALPSFAVLLWLLLLCLIDIQGIPITLELGPLGGRFLAFVWLVASHPRPEIDLTALQAALRGSLGRCPMSHAAPPYCEGLCTPAQSMA